MRTAQLGETRAENGKRKSKMKMMKLMIKVNKARKISAKYKTLINDIDSNKSAIQYGLFQFSLPIL